MCVFSREKLVGQFPIGYSSSIYWHWCAPDNGNNEVKSKINDRNKNENNGHGGVKNSGENKESLERCLNITIIIIMAGAHDGLWRARGYS